MEEPGITYVDTVAESLPSELVSAYHRDGYLLLPPDFLPPGMLDQVLSVIPRVLSDDSPRRILERDGSTVRSVYGPHQTDPVIADMTRSPRLLAAARQLLDDDVYVHQSKVNLKAAFLGDQWEWHQDFINWLQRDRIPRPNLVNVALFLDEVTEFNGPVTFIKGSHREGLLAGVDRDGMPIGYEDAPDWVATLTANEQYQISPEIIQRMARSNEMVSAKGPAGSVLFFHPNVLHASSPNISPFQRAVLFLIYNGVRNAPLANPNPRPEFLAQRDTAALSPLDDRERGAARQPKAG